MIDALLTAYLEARGIDMPSEDGQHFKVLAESGELVEAYGQMMVLGDGLVPRHAVIHELADVVLACAVLAHHLGVTVEEAVATKTAYDRGRDVFGAA